MMLPNANRAFAARLRTKNLSTGANIQKEDAAEFEEIPFKLFYPRSARCALLSGPLAPKALSQDSGGPRLPKAGFKPTHLEGWDVLYNRHLC